MFKQANGPKYQNFMAALHAEILFDWYLEVGCRTGRIFANARGKTIAVDPYFLANTNIIGAKPALHVFQQTSDDFFASGFLNAIKAKLSFSFLDGMHLFEFLLRDFIATEKASDPKGVIALHDCCPFSHEMTTRDLKNLPRQWWTGDVWKLIPILRRYRPDVKITVLDAHPTGLVLVSNLDPDSTVLADAYPEILKEWQEVSLQDYGLDRFNALFVYTSTAQFQAEGFPLFKPVALNPEAVLVPEKITP